MKKKDILLTDLMIGLLLTLIFGVFMLIQPHFLEVLELKWYDLRLRLRQNPDSDYDVSIVEIDGESIRKIGPLPWPSERFAEIIKILSKAGARTIALAVMFNEHEKDTRPNGLKDINADYSVPGSKKMENNEMPGRRQNFSAPVMQMDHYDGLTQAIQDAQNVIFPMYFTVREGPQIPTDAEPGDIPEHVLDQAYLFLGKTELIGLMDVPRGEGLTCPAYELGRAAQGIGHVNVNKDIDGIARGAALVMESEKDYFPSFSIQIARNYMGLGMHEIRVLFGEGVQFGGKIIPTDSRMKMSLSFYGPKRTFPYFSFYDVINQNIALSQFKNKIVIIGLTAPGIRDTLVTPFSAQFPGVEYEATAVQNLLHHNYIRRPSWMGLAEFCLLIFSGIFFSVFLPRLPAKSGITVSSALLVAFLAVSTVLFMLQGVWVKITYPSLLLILGSAIMFARHFSLSGDARVAQSVKIGKLSLGPIAGEGTPARGTAQANTVVKASLGRYQVLGELGREAMGFVYKGVDPKEGRMVAIKTFRFEHKSGFSHVKEIKKKFFAEARLASGLDHPNIVKIYDMDENHDPPWIAMELVKGDSLEAFTKKENLLPLRRILSIIADVSSALDYAHGRNIVHRDIRPANITLLKNGSVKVADFATAACASAWTMQTGNIFGAPDYMSPEQAAGEKGDARSDIFSLGAIFYELLTGEKPFQAENLDMLMYKIANEPHPDPKIKNERIPDICVKILNKALHKKIEKRYQKAGDLMRHSQIIIQKIDEKRLARKQSSV